MSLRLLNQRKRPTVGEIGISGKKQKLELQTFILIGTFFDEAHDKETESKIMINLKTYLKIK